MYRYRYLFYLFLAFIILTSAALLYALVSDREDSFDFDQHDTELNGIFSTYNGKVYAQVPSNGYYEVKGADLSTFITIPDRMDAHIASDSKNVYAGNIILKGLDPKKLTVLGNNYYTDGTVTYYVDPITEANESLSGLEYMIQLLGYQLKMADKPQNYWYRFTELPKGKKYRSSRGAGIAVSDQQVFCNGLPLPKADPENIRPLFIREEKGSGRESIDYFTDGRHVYFQNQLLPLAYNTSLYEIHIDGDLPSRDAYLMDEQTGMVYVDGKSFDPEKAPYQLLSIHLKHANQAIFTSTEGMYFFNTDTEEVERAGENPFMNNRYKEISPDVFVSGYKVYYLEETENRSRKSGLQGRSTHLLELEDIPALSLRQLDFGNMEYGSIWQSGNRYFYFDDLGGSQLMPAAVYQIKNPGTAKQMAASQNLSSDEIRNFWSSGELQEAGNKKIWTATTDFPDNGRHWALWMIGGIFGMLFLILLLFRNKKIAPFFFREDWLIINTFTFSKYKISDIRKVVFSTVKSGARNGGYQGRFFIMMKKGETSRYFTFASGVSLFPESESKIRVYIKELQAQLKKKGIESEEDR